MRTPALEVILEVYCIAKRKEASHKQTTLACESADRRNVWQLCMQGLMRMPELEVYHKTVMANRQSVEPTIDEAMGRAWAAQVSLPACVYVCVHA
jgi:hypothetical protein